MTPSITQAAAQVDQAFLFIFGISAAILVFITILMVWFVYRYHHSRNPQAADIRGNVVAEIIWTVIPVMLVMAMFWYGWTSYQALRSVPADAMQVRVTARMWSWMFEYDNGKRSSTLYVPEGRAVRLDMTSVDVIHSFFVPAFRIKIDTVPGMRTYAWFDAKRLGTYDILCAEYCGLRHANMLSTVEVMEPAAFDAWYGGAGQDDPEVVALLDKYGCSGCHSLDGTDGAGPTLEGLFGKERRVADATGTHMVVADEAYLRRAIREPDVEVVEGYDGMPPYGVDDMPDADLEKLVNFMSAGSSRNLDRGRQLMEEQGCLSCHSTDGSEIAGPTFRNICGHRVLLEDGSETVADDAYLKESIVEPEKKMVKGYEPMMPEYEQLGQEDLDAMIEYMHSLSDQSR